jgi:hypothetical protein
MAMMGHHMYTHTHTHTHLESIFSSQLDVMSAVFISALTDFSAKLSRLRLCRLNVIGSISAKKYTDIYMRQMKKR